MKKVLLISMPFYSIARPAIGISLLKSRLQDEGIPCSTAYFNILFAQMIGLDEYEALCEYTVFNFAEILFAQEYFGAQVPSEQEYLAHCKRLYGPNIRDLFSDISHLKAVAREFLRCCVETFSWEQFDVIGFSTMFEQNIASIALADCIKRSDQTKTIVFGGSNCEQEMGLELHRKFSFIDYVFSGEADLSFPELVKRIRSKQPIKDIPGLVYRRERESVLNPGVAVEDLDALSYPDYDDYFEQLKQASFPPTTCHELPMETSRGCWWGEKSQCRFCGLNGSSIRFRSKSKRRVLQEINYLIERYGNKDSATYISMIDNILDMKYFQDLLPELKQLRLPAEFFYEVKANLTEEQVKMLHDAGIIAIQPGIESLSSYVLRVMNKGVSALQNIQLLKNCQRFGVKPGWSILTGFPGERTADYTDMINLIPMITHLWPPYCNHPFRLDRFSPYINNPEKYGIMNIRPESTYRFIYPFDISSLHNLAYCFDFDYSDSFKPADCDLELSEAIAYWQQCYDNQDYLVADTLSPSVLLIEDGRSSRLISQIFLCGAQKDIYEYCNHIRSLPSILAHVKDKYPDSPIRERDIKDFLAEMVNLNLVVTEGNQYLSLAIPLSETNSQNSDIC